MLLLARGISKVFPGVRALDRVDFRLRSGEIHALLGENGAGKSTLIKVLTGVYGRDGGELLLGGRPLNPRTPLEAQQAGISTVYQEVNLVPQLSVAENLYLGRQPRRWGLLNWGAMRRGAKELLARLGVHVDVAQPVGSYSLAIQQMVAIARAVDRQARVLVLDEPTSSLDAQEVEQLFAVMRQLKANGLGIVFVTHFLDQVYAVSDRLTVLRDGKLVGEFLPKDLPPLALVEKMIGRAADAQPTHTKQRAAAEAPTAPVLRAIGVERKRSIAPFDLELRAGEVVGLAGLLGSGRTEVARLLFGIDRRTAGRIEVHGKPVAMRSPREALQHRMGLSPEDRKREAILPDLSIRENIALALQARRGWLRPLSRRKQQQLAEGFIRRLRIATPDADKPIGQLSGGTQQKCILARWLACEPEVLLLDEPTRGIDVGARAEIERLINELCAAGLAVLLVSSELDEVVRLSDRVAVMRDRRLVAHLDGEQVTMDTVLRTIAAPHE